MAKLDARQDLLQDITHGAMKFKEAFRPVSMLTSGQLEPSTHHILTLPLPQSITSLFVTRGYRPSIAEMLNQAYLDKASSLKEVYERKHREVVKQSLGMSAYIQDMDEFISATHAAYIALYNQSLHSWQLKIDEISQERASSLRGFVSSTDGSRIEPHRAIEKRPTFKPETVPLLEKAFITNSYPNRKDKQSLAEETGMEYKQVNIWFQNRRARSKREGIPLHRTATFAVRSYTSKFSPHSPSPDHSEVTRGTMRPDPTLVVSSPDLVKSHADPFDVIARPPHAFPTSYPPLDDYDVPPAERWAISFQVPWPRRCAATPVKTSVMDIDQLTVQMGDLTLSDGSNNGYHNPLPSFTLILHRAPLPALIRTATASSGAQPVATLASAVGSSPTRLRTLAKLQRALPIRIPHSRERQARPRSPSPTAGNRSAPIAYARASVRTRRTDSRSPSNSSRSTSWSSSASSRNTSSSYSVASSIGPLTPTSTSTRIEAFDKDASPAPSLHHASRSSNVIDGVHTFSIVTEWQSAGH